MERAGRQGQDIITLVFGPRTTIEDRPMGSKGAPPPDLPPLAEASAEAARIQAGLGREQLAFAREQYDRSAPILEGIANQQMAAQSEQMAQARDYYDYQRDTIGHLNVD